MIYKKNIYLLILGKNDLGYTFVNMWSLKVGKILDLVLGNEGY